MSSLAGVTIVPLEGNTFVIGRAPDTEVAIAEPSMSRRHARMKIEDEITIEDLGSTNGTTVQGHRLERGERVSVGLGAVFELGCAVMCVHRMQDLRAVDPERSGRVPARTSSRVPVVCDPTMQHLHALLDVVAPSRLAVLVLGELGVGKEVYAEAIHRRSDRSDGPFVTLDCAGIPEGFIEHEILGYEAGAVAGGTTARAGVLEQADGGTLLLAEVGELPLAAQARLLRIMESGELTRIGGYAPKRVNVRVVASTHRDLRQLIVEGRFRSDLYFRLSGMSVTIPPLRKRQTDIAPIAATIVEEMATRAGRGLVLLTDAAIDALERYHWPGNVRELRDALERALALHTGDTIDIEQLVAADPLAFGDDPEHDERTDRYEMHPSSRRMIRAAITRPPVQAGQGTIPPGSVPPPLTQSGMMNAVTMPPGLPLDETQRMASGDLRTELRTLERQRILDALTKTAGNQSQAAKLLGMSRYTLMSRLETYGIARPRKSRA